MDGDEQIVDLKLTPEEYEQFDTLLIKIMRRQCKRIKDNWVKIKPLDEYEKRREYESMRSQECKNVRICINSI